jgi:2-amino-4-hydroxy-6-hydroxymethyldihydropteridine diphosphokinase
VSSAERRNRAFLSLGSNIEPERHLPWAVRELGRFGRVVKVSRVWETEPVGCPGRQPNYLNAAVLLETSLSAGELKLEAITEIERLLHRVRDPANRCAARTIDIDVALFNDEVLSIEHRHVPDPDILDRAFLAVSLADLDPDYRHPETGRTLAEIAADLPPDAIMRPRPDVDLLSLLP